MRKQREREEELRVKALGLEGQLSNKQQEVERLERMLEIVKQEASAQMHDRVRISCKLRVDFFFFASYYSCE